MLQQLRARWVNDDKKIISDVAKMIILSMKQNIFQAHKRVKRFENGTFYFFSSTSSSPRRSHILFDHQSPIWKLGQSCTFVHGITAQPANVLLNVLYSESFCIPLVG